MDLYLIGCGKLLRMHTTLGCGGKGSSLSLFVQ